MLLPCVVICISPVFSGVEYNAKDALIEEGSDYICRYIHKGGLKYYCLTNTYENYQIVLPTESNDLSGQDLDELFIKFRQKFIQFFGVELFIGIGSEVEKTTEISRSALEAMEMLAYKNQYSDRGVINILNTSRFKHYSLYGEDIMFARVLGCFQDGDLGMMSARLSELVESIRVRPGVSNTAIKRTFIELAVNILHIAANADIDVDSILGDVDIYNWVLKQTHTEILTEWLLNLSADLLKSMETKKETEERGVIIQACDFIAEHIAEPDLCLKTVSGEVGLSESYFSQLFKAEKGIGLNNYITETRITLAQKMLRSTKIKSEDIARQLGFASASYFGRVFKKYIGMTPNDYRKQK